MKNNIKKILHFLHKWVWCFPQNIAAMILKKAVRVESMALYENGTTLYFCYLRTGSVSLGHHIFLCPSHWENDQVIKHEWGHKKQSDLLGPLYLLVIGIPSLIWSKVYRIFTNDYYCFYTEKWANKLGGVE